MGPPHRSLTAQVIQVSTSGCRHRPSDTSSSPSGERWAGRAKLWDHGNPPGVFPWVFPWFSYGFSMWNGQRQTPRQFSESRAISRLGIAAELAARHPAAYPSCSARVHLDIWGVVLRWDYQVLPLPPWRESVSPVVSLESVRYFINRRIRLNIFGWFSFALPFTKGNFYECHVWFMEATCGLGMARNWRHQLGMVGDGKVYHSMVESALQHF